MKAVRAHLQVKCWGCPKQNGTLRSFNTTQRKHKAGVQMRSQFSKKAEKLPVSNISEKETVDDPSMIKEDIYYICTRENQP